jgi:hypothetical protein
MQFVPLEPDIEISGRAVYSIVDGFHLFRRVASSVMQQEGIGRMTNDGDLELDRDGWYPQAASLRAFQRLATDVGEGALFAIGRKMPENAEIPASAVDVVTAIQAIDVGYHLNHRKRGVVMFNPKTGERLDGIGSYAARVDGPRRIVVTCDNPYPCDFDRGIMTAMARKFYSHVVVTHEHGPCRKHSADACAYVVSW